MRRSPVRGSVRGEGGSAPVPARSRDSPGILPARWSRAGARSGELAARGDGGDLHDLVAADQVDAVEEVGDDAGVVRDHAHRVADLGLVGAGGEVDHRVLLGEAGDDGAGVFDDVAVALARSGHGVGGERLGAGVEHRAVGRRAAHHGRLHGERAVLERAVAPADLHPVRIDVGAGAVFGGDRGVFRLVEVGRAAGGDHGRGEARGVERRLGGAEPLFGLLAPALRRVGHQAAEAQARRRGDPAGERHGLLRRLHAAAGGARVAFDEDGEADGRR